MESVIDQKYYSITDLLSADIIHTGTILVALASDNHVQRGHQYMFIEVDGDRACIEKFDYHNTTKMFRYHNTRKCWSKYVFKQDLDNESMESDEEYYNSLLETYYHCQSIALYGQHSSVWMYKGERILREFIVPLQERMGIRPFKKYLLFPPVKITIKYNTTNMLFSWYGKIEERPSIAEFINKTFYGPKIESIRFRKYTDAINVELGLVGSVDTSMRCRCNKIGSCANLSPIRELGRRPDPDMYVNEILYPFCKICASQAIFRDLELELKQKYTELYNRLSYSQPMIMEFNWNNMDDDIINVLCDFIMESLNHTPFSRKKLFDFCTDAIK